MKKFNHRNDRGSYFPHLRLGTDYYMEKIKTRILATLCFSIFLLRLGFRAFGYDLLYHNPNAPYGISDLIEAALAIIYLASLGLCILHALWILLRHWDQGALGASALLTLCTVQWHSYDYLHHLAASLNIY